MRPVIYLCSFGPAVYSEMAGLCVKSLRRFGRYAGPIIVFTNNGFLGSDNDTQVVAIPDRLSYFDNRSRGVNSRLLLEPSGGACHAEDCYEHNQPPIAPEKVANALFIHE